MDVREHATDATLSGDSAGLSGLPEILLSDQPARLPELVVIINSEPRKAFFTNKRARRRRHHQLQAIGKRERGTHSAAERAEG